MNDDAELLRRYAENRSEPDFTAWVQRHFDLVYSAALRQLQGDSHRAREAAQIVFVDAARKAGALSRHPALVGWLYTSTHFAVQKLIRSESRRQAREDTAHALQGLGAASAGESWAELRPYLDAEMLALGSADRTALLLRFFEQKPLAAIGTELGLTENAARMRVDRALVKLRRRLARRGVTSSAAALSAALAGNAVVAAPAGLSAAVAGSSLAEIATVAAGVAGGTAVVTSLMASKFTLGVVVACGLLALGSGIYFREEAQASGRALFAQRQGSTQLEAALRSAQAEEAAEAQRISKLKAGLDARNGAPGAAAPRPAGPVLPNAFETEVAENPKFRAAYARRFMAVYRSQYGPLAEKLGWTAGQLDAVGRLNLGARSQMFDLEHAARLIGADPNSDLAVQAMEKQVQEQKQAAVVGVIGESGVQQMREYDRTFAARDLAEQVAAGSFYSSSPLTPGQAGVLTRLLLGNSAAYQQGGSVELNTVDWDGLITAAAGELPAPQVAALRAVRSDLMRKHLADAAGSAANASP